MKVCVLLPDYSTTQVDYQYYDPPRDLSTLLPNNEVVTIFLNKLTTYKQLKTLSTQGFSIFINLCEGYLEWEVPSIDVIYTLEILNLPHTGPSIQLYDPPKELMKYVAYCSNVLTPNYITINNNVLNIEELNLLHYPLFIKPAKAGDSLGVDEHSLVNNVTELQQKINSLSKEYNEILVEEYIAGREFTVLVMANDDGKTCTALQPIEFIFPKGNKFKTYALKTSELHTDANIPVNDKLLSAQLQQAAQKIFTAFNGVGYARLDFRMNDKNELYFLEINFTCSVFYTNGYEGSADYILKFDGIGPQGFLNHIIKEGIARHQRKQKKYIVKGNAIAGYGIYANTNIKAKEIIFKGEEKAQRIVTKQYVDANWNEKQQEDFKRYAYPISKNVYILWDENAAEWAPQNHSCNANTAYLGLNVIALQNINKGEELTLDYATLLDETAQPFDCECGSSNCRGTVRGTAHNSIDKRSSSAN
ncbi:MAG: SET domain-containing protein-lysine N-methyltransferase [Bacteroidetes bacterium]|nr:SET domain-containing protein-lysine N-methyltransferase [Bacteroidota bacterium]MBS1649030.1 SET domain-containing protein-lysine N-methyltransferase [Bacteroidota bacterium]